MLAIHISRTTLKYAQLVNFKGTPFVESLGKINIKNDLQFPDATNAEMTRSLSNYIRQIRSSAEFPDNATHIVIDSNWFPSLVHQVDNVLTDSDRGKYLGWRFGEMLDSASGNYRMIHQQLTINGVNTQSYLSIGVPHGFNTWLEKIVASSDLNVQNVTLDIQAAGDLLSATGLLDQEGGLQVVLDNQNGSSRCYMYRNKEYVGHFDTTVNENLRVSPDHIRGDISLTMDVCKTLEKALKGKQDPDNVITNLFYFNSGGDPSILRNLNNYGQSCKQIKMIEHFNFRDPDFENIDEYAIVIGALSAEIKAGFSED